MSFSKLAASDTAIRAETSTSIWIRMKKGTERGMMRATKPPVAAANKTSCSTMTTTAAIVTNQTRTIGWPSTRSPAAPCPSSPPTSKVPSRQTINRFSWIKWRGLTAAMCFRRARTISREKKMSQSNLVAWRCRTWRGTRGKQTGAKRRLKSKIAS